MLTVTLTPCPEDHAKLGHPMTSMEILRHTSIPMVADFGCQSCIMPTRRACKLEISDADIIPVKRMMQGAIQKDVGAQCTIVADIFTQDTSGSVRCTKQLIYLSNKMEKASQCRSPGRPWSPASSLPHHPCWDAACCHSGCRLWGNHRAHAPKGHTDHHPYPQDSHQGSSALPRMFLSLNNGSSITTVLPHLTHVSINDYAWWQGNPCICLSTLMSDLLPCTSQHWYPFICKSRSSGSGVGCVARDNGKCWPQYPRDLASGS